MKDITLTFENGIKYNLFVKYKRLAAAAGFCDFDHVEKFYATLKGLFGELIAEHEKEYDSETIPKVCFMLHSSYLSSLSPNLDA